MRRKFLSVVLCVCMMLTMAPFAFAEGKNTPSSDSGSGSGTTTLQSQIDAIESEGTVTLDKDYTETITIPQGKNITLNLHNYKLKGQLNLIGDATIKNGTIEAYSNSVGIYAHSNLTLNAVTLTGAATSASLLCVLAGSNVTIDKNSTVSATDTTASAPDSAIFIGQTDGNANDSQTLNIYGTVTTAKAPSIQGNGTDRSVSHINIYDGAEVKSNKVAIFLPQPCEVNMTGGTVEGYCGIGMKSGTLNLSGGIVNGTNTDTYISDQYSTANGISYDGSAILIDSYIGYAGQVKINISGDATVKSNYSTAIREIGNTPSQTNVVSVTVTGGKVLSGASKDAIQIREASVSTVSLTGGTFSSDVSQYCEKNYYTEKNDDNTYSVKSTKDVAVAQIGDTYYRTLTDAYAALPRGTAAAPAEATTITLLKDSAGGGIGSDTDKYMNYVIDFNGHTYTVGAPAVGSTGTVSQGLRVMKTSTAKFMNGTLKAANYENLIQVVHTYGDVTFQDFTVDATEDSYAWAAVEPDAGTLEILGNSSILAHNGNYGLYTAFWPRGGYVDGTTVTVDTTGMITGTLGYEWDDVADTDKQQTENKAVLNIKNGNFAITKIQTLFTNSIPDNLKVPKISISGGYFTTDPSAYCVTGKTGVASDLSGYAYMVGTKSTSQNPATVDSATVKAEVSSTVPSDKRQDVTNAANSMTAGASATGSDLEAVVKSKSDTNTITGNQAVTNNAVTNYNNNLSNENKLTADNVAIVYQSYIDVKVCDIEKASDSTTTNNNLSELTVELTPMYRVVATKQDNVNVGTALITEGESKNAVVIQEGKELDNVPVKNYELKLALPSNLDTTGGKLSIKHTKENGSIEYYTGTVTKEGTDPNTKTYVTFTTNGFSPFVIYAASANVASIGDGENEQVFTSFQAAVDAVENGGTIKALKDINSTVSGNKTFTVNANSNTVTLTAASGYNLTKDTAGKYTVSRQSSGGPGSSGGSISAPTTYAVNVNAATNGAVAADKKTAAKGTTVTVTASPSKGYVVDAVKVVDKDGKDVAVTGKDGKYVFTMPGSAVTVTGTFKAETPAALPFTDVKSGDWFYPAVQYAYAQGLMTGTSATTFAPNGTMNRAMIVTVLYRLEKSPAVTGASKFTDVPAGQWYSDAVAWAAANKIVNGYDETTFGPMNAVTREQLAAILFRYEQVKGLENVTLEENLNRFPDQNKISAYAIPALQWAVGQKIINGNADGTLDPTGTATRAQVAQIFTNLLNQ